MANERKCGGTGKLDVLVNDKWHQKLPCPGCEDCQPKCTQETATGKPCEPDCKPKCKTCQDTGVVGEWEKEPCCDCGPGAATDGTRCNRGEGCKNCKPKLTKVQKDLLDVLIARCDEPTEQTE